MFRGSIFIFIHFIPVVNSYYFVDLAQLPTPLRYQSLIRESGGNIRAWMLALSTCCPLDYYVVDDDDDDYDWDVDDGGVVCCPYSQSRLDLWTTMVNHFPKWSCCCCYYRLTMASDSDFHCCYCLLMPKKSIKNERKVWF